MPVDGIAGTSMGAIVGAACASGMSVVEMSAAIEQINSDALFTDTPPSADESIRIKRQGYRPLGTAFVGFGYANSANKAVYIYLGKPF